VTVDEALAAFERDWVDDQPVTPRTAYARTLRVLRFWLERDGVAADAPLAGLTADRLRRFVAWHARSGLGDDADASRRAAQHVARLGAYLAVHAGRDDLALARDELRGLVDDAAGA
jgi:hypothetical protein